MRPWVHLVIFGFQQKGTKGTTVVVLVADHKLTIAPVVMLRMSFL